MKKCRIGHQVMKNLVVVGMLLVVGCTNNEVGEPEPKEPISKPFQLPSFAMQADCSESVDAWCIHGVGYVYSNNCTPLLDHDECGCLGLDKGCGRQEEPEF